MQLSVKHEKLEKIRSSKFMRKILLNDIACTSNGET